MDFTFFGDEANRFAMLCFNQMKAYHVTKILKLRNLDIVEIQHFLDHKGIEVEALDYSVFGVEILDKIAKEKRLPIK